MPSPATRPTSLATNFLNLDDTNVSIYAHDPRDTVKQNKAVALIASLTDGVLGWSHFPSTIIATAKHKGECVFGSIVKLMGTPVLPFLEDSGP